MNTANFKDRTQSLRFQHSGNYWVIVSLKARAAKGRGTDTPKMYTEVPETIPHQRFTGNDRTSSRFLRSSWSVKEWLLSLPAK